MRHKKTFYFLAAVLVFMIGGSVGAAAGSNPDKITAYLNRDVHSQVYGEDVKQADAKGNPLLPITCNGTTYVPLRTIADAFMGATFETRFAGGSTLDEAELARRMDKKDFISLILIWRQGSAWAGLCLFDFIVIANARVMII
ncbi:hypothetical protein Q5741_02195 [Paenibacillus sp. JX-17]|uniref:Copper amine oxidase-like N-terminal domain-containing protein n=1 Tax=Paenibacillus lacisoli TaxID=3064525 RepID=A0ABT9C7I2_9BACL|nr:hypothetical protein [Paenibacillus sp. JX-17]